MIASTIRRFLVTGGLSILGGYAQAEIFEPLENYDVSGGLVYDTTQPPVSDPNLFGGLNVAIVASHGVQEEELSYPYEYLKRRGAHIDIVAPEWQENRVLAVRYVKPVSWVKASENFLTAQEKEYDLVLITGGSTNSNTLRKDSALLHFLRQQYNKKAFVSAICSGSQVLIDAGLTKNTKMTGTGSIRKDLENAGSLYLDQPAVADGRILTGRGPSDLKDFMNVIERILVSIRAPSPWQASGQPEQDGIGVVLAAYEEHSSGPILVGPGINGVRSFPSPGPTSMHRPALDCSNVSCQSTDGPGYYPSQRTAHVGICKGGPGYYTYPCCSCD
jgi:protease I